MADGVPDLLIDGNGPEAALTAGAGSTGADGWGK